MIEALAIEVWLSDRDGLFSAFGHERDTKALTLLLNVVLLEVIDYGHVVDFTLIFVSMITAPKLCKLLLSNVIQQISIITLPQKLQATGLTASYLAVILLQAIWLASFLFFVIFSAIR